jgi:predicted nicotinamide N-methyase
MWRWYDVPADRHAFLCVAQVLELGAGTGLAGSAAAALGAGHVLLTDLAYALDNLRTTVARLPLAPPLRAPDVALLDWNDPSTLPPADPAWDVVLAADCIWLDHLVPQHMLSTVVSDCIS